jgi:lipoyl(octanoyl) transferase
MNEIWVVRAGQVPYQDAREIQKRLEEARHAERVPDLLLLLEHPPVYTKGRRSTHDELPMGEDWYRMQGIEVCDTDRGGRVTYHGPGQLVGYPIMSLRALANRAAPGREAEDVARIDVVEFIRRMERVMIEALAAHRVEAGLLEGLTGVWTLGGRPTGDRALFGREAEDIARGDVRKIGSIGVHVNRGVTTHGFAINVNNDLQPFEWIVPCGIEACRVTSLGRELGGAQDMTAFMDSVRDRFAAVYERDPSEREVAELADRVEGLDALAAAGPAAAHASGNGTPAAVR